MDGSVAWWGSSGRITPPAGEFASVSAGGKHTCGVRMDGSVSCWGNNSYRQATPPEGSSPPTASIEPLRGEVGRLRFLLGSQARN